MRIDQHDPEPQRTLTSTLLFKYDKREHSYRSVCGPFDVVIIEDRYQLHKWYLEISAVTCSGHPVLAKAGISTPKAASRIAHRWLLKSVRKMLGSFRLVEETGPKPRRSRHAR